MNIVDSRAMLWMDIGFCTVTTLNVASTEVLI